MIVYLHQYFRTPADWGGTRSWYFSHALAKAGYDVCIITTGTEKKTVYYAEGKITVHYLPVNYRQSYGIFRRGIAFFKYFLLAYFQVLQVKNIQLIYATSTPLSVGFLAWLIKKTKGTKYYFEVRDVWPEVPIAMKMTPLIFPKYLLKKTAEKIYKNAEKIIALSPGIKEIIESYPHKKEIVVIPNFSDTKLFSPSTSNPQLQKQYLPENEKGIVYFGAIGKANHLEYFLNAAQASAAAGLPLKFFVIGEGSEKNRLQKLAEEKQINNLVFLSKIAKQNLPDVLSAMDFSYVSFLHLPALFTSSPNKFFDSLAMGLIPLINMEGWLKEMIQKENAGLYAPPEIPDAFVKAITPFLQNENLLSLYKENARQLAEKEFSEAVCSGKFLSLFTSDKN